MRALYETGNLLEMANISKKTTKLPVNIWIQCEMTTQHNKLLECTIIHNLY